MFIIYRKEKTGVDRFSLRQAVIFLCATNRPDELDPAFVQPGRIDRRLYIGLPDAKQRVQIFGVHSVGKKFSDDVDFEKVCLYHYSRFVDSISVHMTLILVFKHILLFIGAIIVQILVDFPDYRDIIFACYGLFMPLG